MKSAQTTIKYKSLTTSRLLLVSTILPVLVIAVALALRIALAYPVHKYPADADGILAGLCGIQVVHGERPVFFPAGYRLGAETCYVTGIAFSLFGPSRQSLALTGILSATLFICFMYLYLREAFGGSAGLAGLLMVALPPWPFVLYMCVAWPYGEILMYCASTLWLATAVQRKEAQSIWFLMLGVSAGLALWCSSQSLMIILPIAVWLILRRTLRSFASLMLVVAGLLLGTLPISIFVALRGASKILGEGFNHPANALSQIVANADYLVLNLVPWLITDRPGSELSLYSSASAIVLLYVASFIFICYLSVWPNSPLRKTPEMSSQAVLLGLIVMFCGVLFITSGAGSVRGWTVRYILPLYLVVPGIAAIFNKVLKGVRLIITLSCMSLLLALNVKQYPLSGSPLRQSLRDSLLEDEQMIQWLKKEHIQAVLGSYWDVYSLNFDSNGAILGIPISSNEDYLAFDNGLNKKNLRWAIVDTTPKHFIEWEQQLNLKGDIIPMGMKRFLFLPTANPPGNSAAFLDLARTTIHFGDGT